MCDANSRKQKLRQCFSDRMWMLGFGTSRSNLRLKGNDTFLDFTKRLRSTCYSRLISSPAGAFPLVPSRRTIHSEIMHEPCHGT